MKVTERLLGVVAYEPNRQACDVRVTIKSNNPDFNSLAVKATFTGIDWRNLFQGAVVEVGCSDIHDARRYMVTRTFKDVMEVGHTDPVTLVQNIHVEDKEMAMSKDRVRFYIGAKYYKEGNRAAMATVLRKAFDVDRVEANGLFDRSGEGFWIVCRPSQFARFMVYRNDQGLPNGFMDLRAELFEPKPAAKELDVGERDHQACYSPHHPS